MLPEWYRLHPSPPKKEGVEEATDRLMNRQPSKPVWVSISYVGPMDRPDVKAYMEKLAEEAAPSPLGKGLLAWLLGRHL